MLKVHIIENSSAKEAQLLANDFLSKPIKIISIQPYGLGMSSAAYTGILITYIEGTDGSQLAKESSYKSIPYSNPDTFDVNREE